MSNQWAVDSPPSLRTGNETGGKDLLALLLFLLLPPLFFYNVLRVDGTLSPGDGLLHFLPARLLAAEKWRALALPLWNRFILGGFPLAAESQTAAFYPPNLLFLFIGPVWAQNLVMSLHYSLAGIFTLIYARATGLSRATGVFGGIIFMFSGFLTAHRGHTSMHNAAVWIPLVLYFCERWKNQLKARYLVYGGIVYCLQILAGDTKVPVLTALLVACDLGYFALSLRSPKILLGLLLLFAGGLLSGIQLLPTWELANLSVRRQLPYDQFVFGSLPPYTLPVLVFPYLFGAPVSGFYPYTYFGPVNFAELSGYFGVIPWAFVGVAIFQFTRDSRTRFWLLIALLALALAFGRYNPLYRFLYFIPFYNKLRIPARALVLFDFAVAILASRGLQIAIELRRNEPARFRKYVRSSLGGLSFLSLLSVILALNLKKVFTFYGTKGLITLSTNVFSSARLDNPAIYISLSLCVLSIGALASIYVSSSRLGLAPLFSVLILDLFLFAHFSDSNGAYTKYWFNSAYQPETLSYLRRIEPDFNRFRVLSAVEPLYATVPETVGAFEPNTNVFFKLPIVNGYEPLALAPYKERVLDQPLSALIERNRILSLLNVRYLIASSRIAQFIESNRGPAFPDYQRLFQSTDDLVVYRNPQEVPRLFWVAGVRFAADAEAAWKIALDPLFNPRGEAVVVGSTDSTKRRAPLQSAGGTVDVIAETDEYMRALVEANSPGFVVNSQSFYPGWRVYIDGVAATLYPSDGILSGVFLDRGRHMVEFRYEPASFRIGWIVTSLAGFLCVVIIAFESR